MGEPTIADWRELYQAGIAFRQAAPWRWMANEDAFAIVNPFNGETGYCSILGNAGQEFGLGIFLGEQGLRRLAALLAGEPDSDDPDEAAMTPILMFLLSERDSLQEKDLQVIRSLGLSFRGRNAWPLFRSQRPGYVPWFLEREEAIYLAVALRHAIEIARRARDGEVDLEMGLMSGKVLTRYPVGDSWKEEWRPLVVSGGDREASEEPLGPVNEARLILLKDRIREYSGCWEVDIFLVGPAHIGAAGSRPYHPLCFMAVEHEHGLIVHANMTQPWLTVSQKREEIIRLLEKSKTIPLEVRVRSPRIGRILGPIASALGVKLRVCSLHLIEQAKASLYDYLSHR